MDKSEPIKVMIVDDHPIVRSGLGTMLQAFDDLELVGEAALERTLEQQREDRDPGEDTKGDLRADVAEEVEDQAAGDGGTGLQEAAAIDGGLNVELIVVHIDSPFICFAARSRVSPRRGKQQLVGGVLRFLFYASTTAGSSMV